MKYRIPFIIVIFLIVVLVVPAFVIWPNLRSIRTISDSIYSEYTYLEDRNRQGRDIHRAKAEYEALKDHGRELKTLALVPGDELRFITALEELAKSSNVDEQLKLDVEEGKDKGGYRILPFEITASGTYPEVVHYMASLQTLPLVTSLSSVVMSSHPQTSRAGKQTTGYVDARLQGAVYTYMATE